MATGFNNTEFDPICFRYDVCVQTAKCIMMAHINYLQEYSTHLRISGARIKQHTNTTHIYTLARTHLFLFMHRQKQHTATHTHILYHINIV